MLSVCLCVLYTEVGFNPEWKSICIYYELGDTLSQWFDLKYLFGVLALKGKREKEGEKNRNMYAIAGGNSFEGNQYLWGLTCM